MLSQDNILREIWKFGIIETKLEFPTQIKQTEYLKIQVPSSHVLTGVFLLFFQFEFCGPGCAAVLFQQREHPTSFPALELNLL